MPIGTPGWLSAMLLEMLTPPDSIRSPDVPADRPSDREAVRPLRQLKLAQKAKADAQRAPTSSRTRQATRQFKRRVVYHGTTRRGYKSIIEDGLIKCTDPHCQVDVAGIKTNQSHVAVFAASTVAGAVAHVRKTQRHADNLAAGGKKIYVFAICKYDQVRQGHTYTFTPFMPWSEHHEGVFWSSNNVVVDASMVIVVDEL